MLTFVVVGLTRVAKFRLWKSKMTVRHEFGTPDREGFEALLSELFVEYRGMVFRRHAFNAAQIEDRLKAKSKKEVQWELNHAHLFLYCSDIQIQRQWAQELERYWGNRINAEFPDFKVHIDVKDNGQEIIVTFWREDQEDRRQDTALGK